jgi:chemotaxis protein methyltransferase CheR
MTSASPPSAPKLSDRQFERTRRLALDLTGIDLAERHREVLGRRSRRLGIHDSAGLELLLDAAEEGTTAARQKLICLLTTKFTGFFRHPHHFSAAVDQALRAVQQRGHARLWSAAAATGEEPYSLAMASIEAFRRDDPPVTVLATDVDVEALAVAQRGEYSQAALRALDSARRERFFYPAQEARYSSIAAAVRRSIEFRPLNLAAASWPIEGSFDVIFCRNVVMYLDPGCRCAVFVRMASILTPDGLLIIDPAEHLGKAAHLFTPAAAGVYRVQCATRPPSGAAQEVNATPWER